ncbi:breast cancer anti-estrogen resistance protein 1 isoform X1 [Tachyglossus aculeatus]|uniref:breast cancer anti-estrogen resistance protein 1 isoform X1 n=1 Tax=Tachyglossus aculeatus TaxID=9261 RepID=UPI0018F4B13F|nr:breast cancer anti-estrogen resistance protein 1 isoform X1 [Tachyglossus aculeatus]
MNYLNVLAKALYDNVAESPDELSFRKGDIMTVLERDTQGLDGWWLCSLHGRQGIVPGNRLKILVGMYEKKPGGTPGQGQLQPPHASQGLYSGLSPASQYSLMHPAYQSPGDSVYLIPTPSKGPGGVYPGTPTSSKQPPLYPTQSPHHQVQGQPQEFYQVPQSSLNPAQEVYQMPSGPGSPPQDIYQVPPSAGLGQEIYQVPPSLDARNWDGMKPPAKVVVPTRKGQSYVYESSKLEQDEYDIPRHLLSSGPQEIYDVPPLRGLPTSQYSLEVYDTPPLAVKGPNSRDPSLEIYDVPPSIEKSVPGQLQNHHAVYDVPPSVSKDVPDGPIREETYDVPPAFAKPKPFDPSRHPLVLSHASGSAPSTTSEPYPPEDVYDVPPPAGKGGPAPTPCGAREIYDVPPGLRKLATGGPLSTPQDVYDVPRDLALGCSRAASVEAEGECVYDVPPQVDREARPGADAKRLSASSTGSNRSNLSSSSLDVGPARESATLKPPVAGQEPLPLDLDTAMEALVKLQHGVSGSVAHLMSFVCGGWQSPEQVEPQASGLREAVEGVRASVRELLEFARGAVGNAAHSSDRSLHAKLSKQLQKMEDVYQALVKHSQALDSCHWATSALVAGGPPAGAADDLDRFVTCSRGVPDDTKQLASFLHGNASLLFRRTKQPGGDPRLGPEGGSQSPANHSHPPPPAGPSEKASSIQSRPLPSPPKFTSQDSPDGQDEDSEGGWLEDYDYVHLQGKEEFEKTQKELLEKGNIMRQGKGQLEQQQLKQFERLEQEVTRPIDHDLSQWTPPQHYAQVRGGGLGSSDRQLLLFYLEQCESNLTTLTNAVDAFFTAVATNQPPKIFVAHSKFVILSAHKLVFIGDTLSRQAKAPDVRSQVTHYSNLLCDMLKEIVVTTKAAALQYPSPTAAQDMVDRVRELGLSTQQFRRVLGQLAAA